eukprot:862405-Amphidinium_carterae.1
MRDISSCRHPWLSGTVESMNCSGEDHVPLVTCKNASLVHLNEVPQHVRMKACSRISCALKAAGEVGIACLAHRAMSSEGRGSELVKRLRSHGKGVVSPQRHGMGGRRDMPTDRKSGLAESVQDAEASVSFTKALH